MSRVFPIFSTNFAVDFLALLLLPPLLLLPVVAAADAATEGTGTGTGTNSCKRSGIMSRLLTGAASRRLRRFSITGEQQTTE